MWGNKGRICYVVGSVTCYLTVNLSGVSFRVITSKRDSGMPGPVLSLMTALQADAAVPVLLKQDRRLAGHSGLLKMTQQMVKVTVP